MIFKLGPPPVDDTILEEETTWHPVSYPCLMRLQIMGILIALLIAAVIFLLLLTRDSKYISNLSWPSILLLVIPIIPIHECLHAVCFKGGLTSKRVIFGFLPKLFAFYAHYIGKIRWHRYIIILIFPFLILTLIPLTLVTVFQFDYKYLAELALANGMVSAFDVLCVITILKQAPTNSVLINSGMDTYWKAKTTDS